MSKLIKEFYLFGLKQANACLFGAFLLAIMIVTKFWYPIEGLHRYDFIFLAAVAFQIFLLVFKFETPREAIVIIVFHIVATIMELFKTADAIGSWVYPEEFIFGLGNVPLFTGFMYSAVGSYLARVWRIFEFEFANYPPKILTIILVSCIYLNFFTHHFIADARWLLLAMTAFLFWKTTIFFKAKNHYRKMPLLLGWLLVSLFIWFAENIATYANIWIYPNQTESWQLVSFAKISSWYLLMLLSFVLITIIKQMKFKPPTSEQPLTNVGSSGFPPARQLLNISG
jgi:uncharacterized membrane protein YoaT (DUF817 family)